MRLKFSLVFFSSGRNYEKFRFETFIFVTNQISGITYTFINSLTSHLFDLYIEIPFIFSSNQTIFVN